MPVKVLSYSGEVVYPVVIAAGLVPSKVDVFALHPQNLCYVENYSSLKQMSRYHPKTNLYRARDVTLYSTTVETLSLVASC